MLVNDPKNLIGISRSTPAGHLVNGHPSNGYVGHPVNGYMVAGPLTTGHPGHLMTGYVSAGSSGSHGGYSSTGYSSTHSSSSGSYGRTQAALKKPPFAAKPSMPNYVSPKGPDKQPKIPLQSYAATKPSQPYQVQDARARDSSDGKDQRRGIPEHYVSGLSTSVWNCGPDTPAIQISHLPSTPSVPCKDPPNEFATPAKRNSGRPSNLKIQPERVSIFYLMCLSLCAI